MKSSRILDMLEGLELFLYRKSAGIVSVTHAFKDNLVSRGIPASKISVVTNGADLARFRPATRDAALASALGLGGKIVVGYVGTHGMAHALHTVLAAAEILQNEPAAAQVRFLFLGDGAEKAGLKARAEEKGLRNVLFLDTVPRGEVVRYWSLVDLAVIHLRRSPLFETVIPSKLFECMAMGIPVLHGVEGESAAIVEREGCGVTFEPENDAALAGLVRTLAADTELRTEMARRGSEAAARYDRSTLASKMLDVLDTLHEREQTHAAVNRGRDRAS